MSDNILDNAREQMAGLPAPKTLKALTRMYRSAVEEADRVYEAVGRDYENPIYQKLNSLLDFLNDYHGEDKNGNIFDLSTDDSGWRVRYGLHIGHFKKPLSTKWMYKDDGGLSPLDAVSVMFNMNGIMHRLGNLNSQYQFLKRSNKQRDADDFFNALGRMDEVLKNVPAKLLNDPYFQTFTGIDSLMVGNKLPFKAQIELDPLLYTDNRWKIISDFAKGLI